MLTITQSRRVVTAERGRHEGPNASIATSWVTNCQTVLLLEAERRAKVLNRRVRRVENRETQQIPQTSLANQKQKMLVKPCSLLSQPHHFTVLPPSLVSPTRDIAPLLTAEHLSTTALTSQKLKISSPYPTP